MYENNLVFHRKINFSDESHFHLGGFINKLNCHIWNSENSRVIIEKPLHSQRVTAWCDFWSGASPDGMAYIALYFFENEGGATYSMMGIG